MKPEIMSKSKQKKIGSDIAMVCSLKNRNHKNRYG